MAVSARNVVKFAISTIFGINVILSAAVVVKREKGNIIGTAANAPSVGKTTTNGSHAHIPLQDTTIL